MGNVESKAWELIGQLTPSEQFYFALKILQHVRPHDIETKDESETPKLYSTDEDLVNLVLGRKASLENGASLPITLQQFKEELVTAIEENRS